MTGAEGIARLGALFYVAAKVRQLLAWEEAIPLLRSFVLGLCAMFFPCSCWRLSTWCCTDSERMQLTYGNADFDNERVPCTERQADLYKTHVSYNIADNGFTKIEQQDFSIKVEKEMNL